MKTAIATALLAILTLLSNPVFANELLIENMLSADRSIPFEIKSVAMNEFSRHINKTEPLYKSRISPSVFTLSNNSTYMLFEIAESTGYAHLRMFVQVSDETGQVDLLWAKEMGLHRKTARR
ncbi:MAG: hypothetical protein ACE5EN_07245 [Nitrospinota bacterium]